ncbi:uncharacterized protein LY79DRAFT_697513 [Colletotrichum navitas]|uniref:Chromo domain-containing protein n=1 Tax=Colletotrichum navitas TaxID=681940 RepID=A0AAD8PNU3_9PEZI|nr:uncharacterized protein LY79DRAFT_697513 [Colletotrichum navitas]KAK1573482.1 hypothetical protein LY79DRAFT_697513 [Colletotrichum navitas]
MCCQWRQGGSTWEEEESLQLDEPDIWRTYVSTHNTKEVLEDRQDFWYILDVRSHSIRAGEVLMRVRWVGSMKEPFETESYVRANRPAALVKYWKDLGGREAAL